MLPILLILSISLSLIFVFLSHPLSLGLILLIQTIIVALMTGLMSLNFWFSYIIFLIMIGGMLILFIYMTSIASNEKFSISLWINIIFFSSLFIMSMIFFIDHFFFYYIQNTMDLMNQNVNLNYKLSLNKFLNYPMSNIFMLLIIYLLITLIMVVKVTNIQYGPLRQKY
uniref:NADH-ubiquinone oxidoreductase chain 6 n=1 Tax=Chrysomeloidea sp. 6 KM-2017 TaxID=2219300 RepID=A0A346RHQ1_9CUCU|nr:NADH dehydrogenase subunit 6 [Chrysomeloidea sp. 6 KM-2017]